MAERGGTGVVYKPVPAKSLFMCKFRDDACILGKSTNGSQPGPWFQAGEPRGSYFNARRGHWDGICSKHWLPTLLSLQEEALPAEGSPSEGLVERGGVGFDAGRPGGSTAASAVAGAKRACAAGLDGGATEPSALQEGSASSIARGGKGKKRASSNAFPDSEIRYVRRRGYSAAVTKGTVCSNMAILNCAHPHLKKPTATDEDLSPFVETREQRHATWDTEEVGGMVKAVLSRASVGIPFPLSDGGLSAATDPVEMARNASLPYIPLGRPENRASAHKDDTGWTMDGMREALGEFVVGGTLVLFVPEVRQHRRTDSRMIPVHDTCFYCTPSTCHTRHDSSTSV